MLEANNTRRSSAQPSVSLLLPGNLSPERNRALAEKIVNALRTDARTRDAFAKTSAAQPNLVGMEDPIDAPPAGVPVLNEFTGVLVVPLPVGGVEAVNAVLRNVPEGRGVTVEPIANYGIPE